LRARTIAWENHRPPTGGRPRSGDMLEFVDVLVATGERTGEVLALLWEDIEHLDDLTQPCRVTITGTINKRGKREPFPNVVCHEDGTSVT